MTDLDEFGQWTGTCDKCGTNHDGHPPETLGGEMRCLRARADRAGDQGLMAYVQGLMAYVGDQRDDILRQMGLVP